MKIAPFIHSLINSFIPKNLCSGIYAWNAETKPAMNRFPVYISTLPGSNTSLYLYDWGLHKVTHTFRT
jgi:hypothetical protein